MEPWYAQKIPADLHKKPRPRSSSPPIRKHDGADSSRSSSVTSRRQRKHEEKLYTNPPQIISISPKIVPKTKEDNKFRFLDSIHIRRLFPERPVMTRPVNHVAIHRFDTMDYKTEKNESAILDTNAFCRSISFKDPNTNVNHIITFENFYDFYHEYEAQDPAVAVDPRCKPSMEIEKQVQMSVQVVSPAEDNQLLENKYLYNFDHKIRVYCPQMKLQTWATTHRPVEITDYSDVDPYLSASTAVNPTLLQVHYHHITHHVKLVHLVCKPRSMELIQ